VCTFLDVECCEELTNLSVLQRERAIIREKDVVIVTNYVIGPLPEIDNVARPMRNIVLYSIRDVPATIKILHSFADEPMLV
jgi:hypothetical protein